MRPAPNERHVVVQIARADRLPFLRENPAFASDERPRRKVNVAEGEKTRVIVLFLRDHSVRVFSWGPDRTRWDKLCQQVDQGDGPIVRLQAAIIDDGDHWPGPDWTLYPNGRIER